MYDDGRVVVPVLTEPSACRQHDHKQHQTTPAIQRDDLESPSVMPHWVTSGLVLVLGVSVVVSVGVFLRHDKFNPKIEVDSTLTQTLTPTTIRNLEVTHRVFLSM